MKKNSFWALVFILGSAFGVSGQEDWEKTRSAAEARYELVLLKVERKQFDDAVATAKEIFALPFPPEKHELLFDSAKEISDALIHHNEMERALVVLQACFDAVELKPIHAKLHKEMAYVYKKMGDDEKAMKHFEKAIELGKAP